MYKLTNKDLIDKFNEFNQKYFYNVLTYPKIEITEAKTYLGKYSYKWPKYLSGKDRHIHRIQISEFYQRTEVEYERTLLHEMIHEFQEIEYDAVDHGPTFQEQAARIKELSKGLYDIESCSDISGDVLLEDRSKWTELLLVKYKGLWRYAKPTAENSEHLIKVYSNIAGLEIKRVQAYGDFRKITTSVKRLNTKYIDNIEEFKKTYKIA